MTARSVHRQIYPFTVRDDLSSSSDEAIEPVVCSAYGMFYVIIFAGLAVLLVVAGLTLQARNRSRLRAETPHRPTPTQRRNRKQERAQSRAARRRR